MFSKKFDDSRWDAIYEYIKGLHDETKRYVDKKLEILKDRIDLYDKSTHTYTNDLVKIQQIVIDHLHNRIQILEKQTDKLEKEVNELKKKIEG